MTGSIPLPKSNVLQLSWGNEIKPKAWDKHNIGTYCMKLLLWQSMLGA